MVIRAAIPFIFALDADTRIRKKAAHTFVQIFVVSISANKLSRYDGYCKGNCRSLSDQVLTKKCRGSERILFMGTSIYLILSTKKHAPGVLTRDERDLFIDRGKTVLDFASGTSFPKALEWFPPFAVEKHPLGKTSQFDLASA